MTAKDNSTMAVLRNNSIAVRLCIHTAIAICAALVLCLAAFVASDVVGSRSARTEQLNALAMVLGENTVSALEFDDPDAATLTLSSLAKQPGVDCAILYNRQGQVFAAYPTAATTASSANESDVTVNYAIHSVRVSGLFLDVFDERPPADTATAEALQSAGSGVVGRLELHGNLRDISSQFARRLGLVCLVFAGSLVIGICVSMYFQRAITAPIRELAEASQHIADRQDYSIRITKRSEDEIGVLTDAFNSMITEVQAAGGRLQITNAQLEQRVQQRTAELATSNEVLQQEMQERESLQSELLNTSRQAGMAEVATGVLHNVGNVLNSVNVSANVLGEKLRQSRVSSLQKASDVICNERDLGSFLTTDARGRHFPTLLKELSNSLVDERDGELDELASLVTNIEHIKEIVSMQQSFACSRGATESVQLAALVEDSLKITTASLSGHGVIVKRDFRDAPDLVTEKHKLLQILINLISNAKHALDSSDQETKQVTLSIASGDDAVCIEVRDNGAGIPSENLTKIFAHGFTTKKTGHGFGLHSSALAAQELGGSLCAHSDGPGKGATFTLRLPLQQTPRRNAVAPTSVAS